MESRLLTGTAGIPLLRKQLRQSPTCFATAKPIGNVADGGNLIWGRQLRPAILLDTTHPFTKRDILKPVLAAAAASSPADSSGNAKVDKNPAFVTGFFFLLWYIFTVTFNILNKKIYNYFPYPYFVSVIHLFVGVVYCLASWSVSLPRRAPIDSNLFKMLIPVAIWHALGHVATNVSIAAVAVSFTHTVKATGPFPVGMYFIFSTGLFPVDFIESLEPFFNVVASQFILGQAIPFTIWLSLAPVVIGVSVATLTELSFNQLGFISAMISNISFTFRSLYSKKAMADMDSSNLYAYISIIALLICIPPAIIAEGPQLVKHGFNDVIAKVGLTKFISDLFLVGLFYHLYNQWAMNALGRVAPSTHAIGNGLKRVLVIGCSILVFGNTFSLQTGIGTSIAMVGVALYSLVKAQKK